MASNISIGLVLWLVTACNLLFTSSLAATVTSSDQQTTTTTKKPTTTAAPDSSTTTIIAICVGVFVGIPVLILIICVLKSCIKCDGKSKKDKDAKEKADKFRWGHKRNTTPGDAANTQGYTNNGGALEDADHTGHYDQGYGSQNYDYEENQGHGNYEGYENEQYDGQYDQDGNYYDYTQSDQQNYGYDNAYDDTYPNTVEQNAPDGNDDRGLSATDGPLFSPKNKITPEPPKNEPTSASNVISNKNVTDNFLVAGPGFVDDNVEAAGNEEEGGIKKKKKKKNKQKEKEDPENQDDADEANAEKNEKKKKKKKKNKEVNALDDAGVNDADPEQTETKKKKKKKNKKAKEDDVVEEDLD